MSTKPIDRAIEAGRALIAEGEAATGAAIRARAGVAMATAVEAARVLKHEQDTTEVEPEVTETPDVVAAAAASMWAAAQKAARDELAEDRAAFLARIREAETTAEEARAEMVETAAEVDRLAAEVEEATRRVEIYAAENSRFENRAVTAEQRASDLAAEVEELTRRLAEVPKPDESTESTKETPDATKPPRRRRETKAAPRDTVAE